ncbi:hypothetical protein U27_00225 [Candidatus Vecturithrix granuli]|uniref:Uncharacterized protein n=1 Tax=Vecturithrix granuli TaxID=1499967 RepID=A0A081C6X9_VECG1|nr:hypothetical protein U27_00225 [Candidatus Vecturithrix granuli]
MKFLEKVTEGAGIALNYMAGVASLWFGAVCTLIAFVIWSVAGVGLPSIFFFAIFGIAPLGGGVWLVQRGRIQRQLLKVKLQKEMVRKLAFRHQGRLKPADLAREQDWTEERALETLKNLAAEDPERIELQLNYDSGDIYFEFSDIIRAIEQREAYQALPISETLERKAIDIALTLGKTIDTFQEYLAYTRQTASQRQTQKKEELYRTKIERFLREVDELKQQ